MKTIIRFESPGEFLDAVSHCRAVGDKLPILPSEVYAVSDGGKIKLFGKGSDGFEVAFDYGQLSKAAIRRCGIEVRLSEHSLPTSTE